MIDCSPTSPRPWLANCTALVLSGGIVACQTPGERAPAQSTHDASSPRTEGSVGQAPGEPPSGGPQPTSSASEKAPPSPPSPAWLIDLLAQSSAPSAVVVLDNEGELDALGGNHGLNPAHLALRPGSTLKPLLAWGAAQAGQAVSEPYVCARDFESVPGMHCFDQHGSLTLPEAIERSCNTFFFHLAYDWGARGVIGNLQHFGFGKSTRLVATESTGALLTEKQLTLLPNAKFPAPTWAPLIATGHGPIQVTLLQLTRAYVQLVDELQVPQLAPHLEESSRLIQTGLARVVDGESGTAKMLSKLPFPVAGKTGSAEGGDFRSEAAGPKQPNNGWFVGFFPPDEPRHFVGVVTLGTGGAQAEALPLVVRVFNHLAAKGP